MENVYSSFNQKCKARVQGAGSDGDSFINFNFRNQIKIFKNIDKSSLAFTLFQLLVIHFFAASTNNFYCGNVWSSHHHSDIKECINICSFILANCHIFKCKTCIYILGLHISVVVFNFQRKHNPYVT